MYKCDVRRKRKYQEIFYKIIERPDDYYFKFAITYQFIT